MSIQSPELIVSNGEADSGHASTNFSHRCLTHRGVPAS